MFILVLGYGLSDIESFPGKIYVAPQIDSRTTVSMMGIAQGYRPADDDDDGMDVQLRRLREEAQNSAASKETTHWGALMTDGSQLMQGPLSFVGAEAAVRDAPPTPIIDDRRKLASHLSAGDLWAFRKLLTDIITGPLPIPTLENFLWIQVSLPNTNTALSHLVSLNVEPNRLEPRRACPEAAPHCERLRQSLRESPGAGGAAFHRIRAVVG
jgi:hypothetical protein